MYMVEGLTFKPQRHRLISAFSVALYHSNAKVGREDIFKPTIGNESLHETSNDNGVRVVNFASSKNLVVKSIMFPHRKIRKYTWTSPDGKTHNQIDHVLVDRRQQSSILDVRSFRGAVCDTDHYLVAAKLRERLSASKRVAQKFDMQRFDLRKLNDAEFKEQSKLQTGLQLWKILMIMWI
jgi:hypothetical protein